MVRPEPAWAGASALPRSRRTLRRLISAISFNPQIGITGLRSGIAEKLAEMGGESHADKV